jgi:hypothetical protein
VKACAGADGFRREERIKKHLEAAEERIRTLQECPEEETSRRQKKAHERSAGEKKERSELAKIRQGKTEEKALEARASMTDPDSEDHEAVR